MIDSDSPAIERENFSTVAVKALPNANKLRLNLTSISLVSAGFLLIVWACFSGDFRSVENTLNAEFCLPFSIGLALILNGIFIRSKFQETAFWLSLALVGQAATLQMIDAGRLIHFQHYKSLNEMLQQEVLPLALFVIQIGSITFAIGRRFSVIKNWFSRNFKLWQLLLTAVFLIFAGAAVTPNISIYAESLLTAAVVQFVNLANIVLLVWSAPDESLVRLKEKTIFIFDDSAASDKNGVTRFSLFAALWVALIAGFFSYFVYQAHPHVPDEVQYLFQANYMAAGQLTVKAPPVPEAFSMYMIPQNEAEWFAIFPPGWSAVLAVGVKLNAVWLVNPLLGGLCILLAYMFFQEQYSHRFARTSILLLCCSPWFIFMAMSFMSHIFTLVCALSAAVLLQRAFKTNRSIFVFASGIAIGFLSLTRPLDAAIIAILLGVWTLFGFHNWRKRFLNAFVLAIGTMATAALILPYNRAVTGKALLSPMDAYYTKYFWSGVMSYGFGANRGFGWGLDAFPGHSPLEALINAALNTFLLNTELFGWATGSLVLTIFYVFSGNLRRKDFWAVAVIGTVIGAYSLFWYHGGPDFGARYWFLSIIPLVALTVRSIEWLGRKLNENDAESIGEMRVMLGVAALCLLSLVNFFPWRALDKYFHYLEMQPGIAQLARESNFGRSLILIRGAEHPDYQSAWVYNPLNFEGDAPVYAFDKSPEIRAQLLKVYAERPIWIVDGPTLTGGNYRIERGPLSAVELSEETFR